jgi:hypothetical protein
MLGSRQTSARDYSNLLAGLLQVKANRALAKMGGEGHGFGGAAGGMPGADVLPQAETKRTSEPERQGVPGRRPDAKCERRPGAETERESHHQPRKRRAMPPPPAEASSASPTMAETAVAAEKAAVAETARAAIKPPPVVVAAREMAAHAPGEDTEGPPPPADLRTALHLDMNAGDSSSSEGDAMEDNPTPNPNPNAGDSSSSEAEAVEDSAAHTHQPRAPEASVTDTGAMPQLEASHGASSGTSRAPVTANRNVIDLTGDSD